MLQHEEAAAALDACLLTEEEMAGGDQAWAALPDPFAAAWDLEMMSAAQEGHAHDHAHEHAHEN